MLEARGFAAAAIMLMGAGCVPLTDYRKLEDRFKDQEKYVSKHKDELKEFEKREQFLTLQAKERMKENELLRNRLTISERMRSQNGKPMVVTEQPASTKATSDATFAGFHVNGDTGGIVLESDVLFASGSATLKDSGKKTIEELVSKLQSSEYSKYYVRVDGHTDDQPVTKTKEKNHDNWELGGKRAKAVLDFILSKGISPERCFFASFGEQRPIMKTGKGKGSKDSRAQNRRVEIVLFEKKV